MHTEIIDHAELTHIICERSICNCEPMHIRINTGVIRQLCKDNKMATDILFENVDLLKEIIQENNTTPDRFIPDLCDDPDYDNDTDNTEYFTYKHRLDFLSDIIKLQELHAEYRRKIMEIRENYTNLEKLCPRIYNQPVQPVKDTKQFTLSVELATFLEKPLGTKILRTDVTREILNYILKRKLQDNDDPRIINPDKNLRRLLKVPDTEVLTYFNLQKYLTPHFIKK